MSESTVVQPCNYSGLYDFDAYPDLAKFGICSYDWSSAKKTWVNHSPMDADVMLLTQAAENKARNPHAKVFVCERMRHFFFVCVFFARGVAVSLTWKRLLFRPQHRQGSSERRSLTKMIFVF